jgi:hypothetical protein
MCYIDEESSHILEEEMSVLLIQYKVLFSLCRHEYAAIASSRVSYVRACVYVCVFCYYSDVPAEYMFGATVPKDSGCSCVPREQEFFLQSGSHRKYQFVNTKIFLCIGSHQQPLFDLLHDIRGGS